MPRHRSLPVNKTATALAIIAGCLLLIYVAIIDLYVLPVYQAMFLGLGISVGLPAQLAFRFGTTWVVAAVLVILIAGIMMERAGKTGARVTALHGANLLLVGYVVMQAGVWINMAITIPQVATSLDTLRQRTRATQQAPAPDTVKAAPRH